MELWVQNLGTNNVVAVCYSQVAITQQACSKINHSVWLCAKHALTNINVDVLVMEFGINHVDVDCGYLKVVTPDPGGIIKLGNVQFVKTVYKYGRYAVQDGKSVPETILVRP